MILPSLSESHGIFWVSLAAGLLGIITGKLYSLVANQIRASQILSDMPKAPGKVRISYCKHWPHSLELKKTPEKY